MMMRLTYVGTPTRITRERGRTEGERVSKTYEPEIYGGTKLDLSATDVRRLILEQSKRANVGHIGSALSIADIVTALYGQILHVRHPDDADRDRFVLSKGHA